MRTKLCLDFTATLYLGHVFITFLYDDLTVPTSMYYWCFFALLIIIVTVVGERLCMMMELGDIPLDFLSAGDAKNKTSDGKGDAKASLPTAKSPHSDIEIPTLTTTSSSQPSNNNSDILKRINSSALNSPSQSSRQFTNKQQQQQQHENAIISAKKEQYGQDVNLRMTNTPSKSNFSRNNNSDSDIDDDDANHEFRPLNVERW